MKWQLVQQGQSILKEGQFVVFIRLDIKAFFDNQGFPKKYSEFGCKYLIVGYKWWVSFSRIWFSGCRFLTPGRQEGAKLFSYCGTSSSLWTIRSSVRIQVIHFSAYSTYIRNFFHRTVSVTFKYFMWTCCSSDWYFFLTLYRNLFADFYLTKSITPN